MMMMVLLRRKMVMVMMMMSMTTKFAFHSLPMPSGLLRFVTLLTFLREPTTAATAVGQLILQVVILIIIIVFIVVLIFLLVTPFGDPFHPQDLVLWLVGVGAASVLAQAST